MKPKRADDESPLAAIDELAAAHRLTDRSQIFPSSAIQAFHDFLYSYYKRNKRQFPWRRTTIAYRILVSEVMLQQTQTFRVVEKYEEFLEAFPDVRSLASAATRDVLHAWQGLGYNRRALALQKAAVLIVERHSGIVPRSVEALDDLPGIGRATAAAVMAYAFNFPEIFVETNVRTVFSHLFHGKETLPDQEVERLLAIFLDRSNPRRFYNALMDLGVALKKAIGKTPGRIGQARKQPRFEGSNRQLRGQLLRLLLKKKSLTAASAATVLGTDQQRTEACLEQLENEGFLTKRKQAAQQVFTTIALHPPTPKPSRDPP